MLSLVLPLGPGSFEKVLFTIPLRPFKASAFESEELRPDIFLAADKD